MSAFVIFALVVTLLMILYYGIMIALDLRKLGKKPSSSHEEFDVSSMQDQDESYAVDESKYKLPDAESEETESQSEELHPVVQVFEPVSPETATRSMIKPKSVEQAESKMKDVEISTSGESDVDEFLDIMAQGDWVGPKFRPDL